MPRPRLTERPASLHIHLPETTKAKLDLLLFSELEQRVPPGAYAQFFTRVIEEGRGSHRLDLTPYGFPEGFWVAGPKEMVEALVARLAGGVRYAD